MEREGRWLRMDLVTVLLATSCLACAASLSLAAAPGGLEPGGRAPDTPGADTNPIPVAGIEALAPRGEALSPRGAYSFRLGPVLAALHGVQGEALPSRYGVVMDVAGAGPATSDSYAGGALEMGTETGSLRVEVGRVTPRDPVSVALLGGAGEPYWASAVVFGIRF